MDIYWNEVSKKNDKVRNGEPDLTQCTSNIQRSLAKACRKVRAWAASWSMVRHWLKHLMEHWFVFGNDDISYGAAAAAQTVQSRAAAAVTLQPNHSQPAEHDQNKLELLLQQKFSANANFRWFDWMESQIKASGLWQNVWAERERIVMVKNGGNAVWRLKNQASLHNLSDGKSH